MAKGDDIQERLTNFAVGIIQLCEKMPDSNSGRHVANQLLRCGTSPAPNYGEARGAESKRDFVHKLGVVLKELNESHIWLETIQRSNLLAAKFLAPLLAECTELSRIINASISTAKEKRQRSIAND